LAVAEEVGMKLQSDFALLDVKHGRVGLLKKVGTGGDLPENPNTVPVIIHGHIDYAWGDDDGVSREFAVIVDRVDVVD
jgi:hypothetical protein